MNGGLKDGGRGDQFDASERILQSFGRHQSVQQCGVPLLLMAVGHPTRMGAFFRTTFSRLRGLYVANRRGDAEAVVGASQLHPGTREVPIGRQAVLLKSLSVIVFVIELSEGCLVLPSLLLAVLRKPDAAEGTACRDDAKPCSRSWLSLLLPVRGYRSASNKGGGQ